MREAHNLIGESLSLIGGFVCGMMFRVIKINNKKK